MAPNFTNFLQPLGVDLKQMAILVMDFSSHLAIGKETASVAIKVLTDTILPYRVPRFQGEPSRENTDTSDPWPDSMLRACRMISMSHMLCFSLTIHHVGSFFVSVCSMLDSFAANPCHRWHFAELFCYADHGSIFLPTAARKSHIPYSQKKNVCHHKYQPSQPPFAVVHVAVRRQDKLCTALSCRPVVPCNPRKKQGGDAVLHPEAPLFVVVIVSLGFYVVVLWGK
eukprot:s70_g25.t1